MDILALIPARGGSQRVPGKNIMPLDGKALIGYTIEAAIHSKYISRTLLSTDSAEIASIGRSFGAEVPFLRPGEIAKSDSTEMQFLEHMLDWLKHNEGYEPDLIVILYPTSPFRKSETIDKAIEEIGRHPHADSLRSVKLCTEHPYKMWLHDEEYLKPFVQSNDKNTHTLSYQLLPTVYIQNASIYITKPATIRIKKSPTGDLIVPFVMNEVESIDINNPLDFMLAEAIIASQKQ